MRGASEFRHVCLLQRIRYVVLFEATIWAPNDVHPNHFLLILEQITGTAVIFFVQNCPVYYWNFIIKKVEVATNEKKMNHWVVNLCEFDTSILCHINDLYRC